MKIFLDLDGVVTDFVTDAMRYNGVEDFIYPVECGWDVVMACNRLRDKKGLPLLKTSEFWDTLDCLFFWADLKPYPGALDFVERVSKYGELYIATSPTESPLSSWGKHMWINKHLPEYSRRFFIGPQKHLLADRDSVLIDDSDSNCKKFEEAGGTSILVPRPWNVYGGSYNSFLTVERHLHAISL